MDAHSEGLLAESPKTASWDEYHDALDSKVSLATSEFRKRKAKRQESLWCSPTGAGTFRGFTTGSVPAAKMQAEKEEHSINLAYWRHLIRIIAIGLNDVQGFALFIVGLGLNTFYAWVMAKVLPVLGGLFSSIGQQYLIYLAPNQRAQIHGCVNAASNFPGGKVRSAFDIVWKCMAALHDMD